MEKVFVTIGLQDCNFISTPGLVLVVADVAKDPRVFDEDVTAMAQP